MGKVEEEKGPAQTGTATTKKQRLLGARLETATLDSSARYSVAIEYMCPGAAEAAAQSVLVLA